MVLPCSPSFTGSRASDKPGAIQTRGYSIASHWPFEQWGRFLPEYTTAASILDRLLHHATIVITDGDSYRMTHRTEVPPT
ncbi:hypothetical protein GORBP_095_00210 [Gordonia rubripertincta NBRC 101908]|uniref:IstB-like ATP-binding domain-containing protein n=1 Tax=Gordonia rubripertincta NBRC 101908 TaxID=1077975 RepID=A0ABQ0HXZ2_GORRU|nr:hypothetical protein GORBP_095_00210 [Gordonia rubripertincta NBRC 101908]